MLRQRELGEEITKGRTEGRHEALSFWDAGSEADFFFNGLLPLRLRHSLFLKVVTVNHRKRMSQGNSWGQSTHTVPNSINFLSSN